MYHPTINAWLTHQLYYAESKEKRKIIFLSYLSLSLLTCFQPYTHIRTLMQTKTFSSVKLYIFSRQSLHHGLPLQIFWFTIKNVYFFVFERCMFVFSLNVLYVCFWVVKKDMKHRVIIFPKCILLFRIIVTNPLQWLTLFTKYILLCFWKMYVCIFLHIIITYYKF